MDERLNLTPAQLRLIQKMSRYNECRISHISGRNSPFVVVRNLQQHDRIRRIGFGI
jgi:hypothetical protein